MDSQSNEPIRTRSRSKTPGLSLRVSADKDVNGDTVGRSDKKSKKAPNVTTIEEELNSTKKSLAAADGGAGARSIRQTRTVTSDYSSDGVSPDKGTFKQSSKSITITMSSSATSSSAMKTTQQLSSSAPDKKEVRQNEINRVLENTQAAILRTSTPKAASKGQKTVTLTPEELKQHAAYKEYKEAGEYWNKFPKTDYTYSELSPHRREIVPGVVAMPNMSRPGLSKHTERINVMIQRNPTQETYIRQRYASSNYSSAGISGGNFAHVDPYDSGDEQLDFSRVSKSNSHRNSYWKSSATSSQVQLEHRSIINRFFLAMVNLFYSSAHAISRTFNRSEHNLYYTRIEDERSFIIKIYSFFASLTTNIFKKIYLLISSVLFLDTWLLQTASSDVQQGRRKRKFLLLLLILLPFLLFGGIYLYLDPTPLQSWRESLANPLLNYDFKLDLPIDTEAAKLYALDKWDGVTEFTGYYFDHLKLFSANAIGEARKIWQENVNNLF